MRNHQFSRLAWVNFSNEHDCEQALVKIPCITVDDFQLQAARSVPNKKRTPVRITPPLPEKQVDYDFELCKMLIQQVLDPEKGIETDVVEALEKIELSPGESATNLEGEGQEPVRLSMSQKLDFLLLYLRRVHAYCLYCGEEYEDERMLSTRCGPQHIRNHQKISNEEFDDIMAKSKQLSKLVDSEAPNDEQDQQEESLQDTLDQISKLKSESCAKWGGSITFLKRYVEQALKKIRAGPRKYVDPAEEFKAQDVEEFCRCKCKQITPNERYSCDLCGKVFKGEEFVIKHIKNKHQEVIEEIYERESTQDWIEKNLL